MAQGILPVLGLFIILFEVNVKKWFLTIIKIVLPTIGIVYCALEQISNPAYPVYWQFLVYSIAISVFLHFLQARNPDNNTKVLGLTLIVAHLFSQYWEIPIFIAGHLGVLGAVYTSSFDQLYLILVFYLAIKYANIMVNRKTITYLLIPIIYSAIAVYVLPGKIQTPFGYVNVMPGYTARCVSCFFLGKAFVDRSVL